MPPVLRLPSWLAEPWIRKLTQVRFQIPHSTLVKIVEKLEQRRHQSMNDI